MKRIYLDNAATTPLLPEVLDAMLPWLGEKFGNPSSIHAHGREAKVAVERAREHVAAMIGADTREIVFTSGGSESDNSALRMALQGVDAGSGGRIISSRAEHHAVHVPLEQLAQQGFPLDLVEVDSGAVPNIAAIRERITPETKLIALMHVNNETGGVLPLVEVGALAEEHDVLFFSDIVQGAGKLPVDVHAAKLDFAAMTAHKIHGPKGIGALYIRSGTEANSFISGGGQERGRRGGTENVAGIVGFGEAARLATAERETRHARWMEYRTLARARVLEAFAEAIVNDTPHGENAANILSFSFPATRYSVDGATMLMNCDLADLSVSGGSACTAGSIEASHVMRAIGHDAATGAATVRISFGAATTIDDVAEGTAILIRVLQEMDGRSNPRSHSLNTTP